MKSSRFAQLILLFFAGTVPADAAEGVQGASAVLKQVQAAVASAQAGEAPQTEAARLKADFDRLKAELPQLDSKATAQRWLELASRFVAAPRDFSARREPKSLTGEKVVASMPGPAAWQDLIAAIDSRPPPKEKESLPIELAFQLLAATLSGNTASQQQIVAKIQSHASAAAGTDRYAWSSLLHSLDELILETAPDPDAVVAVLERRLLDSAPEIRDRQLRVPDLVPLVGQEKATAFFRRALTNEIELEFDYEAHATADLARKIARELMPQLKVPQWSLASSIDAVDFFEAMQARFGGKTRQRDEDYGFRHAQTYYLLGLIVRNRHDDALKVAGQIRSENYNSIPVEALRALERAGHTEALAEFFHKLLSGNPELPFWETYFQLAAKANQVDKMLALARSAVAKADSTRTRAQILEDFHLALLAGDRVEEGVAELRKLINTPARRPSFGVTVYRGPHSIRLMRLGKLLKNDAWIEEGIAAFRKQAAAASEGPVFSPDADALHDFVEIMVERDKAPEAESLLTAALIAGAKQKPDPYRFMNVQSSGPLVALAFLYSAIGRHADVLTLFDEAPNWGRRDLLEFVQREYGAWGFHRSGRSTYSVPILAARTFLALGRNDLALQMAHAVLNVHGGDDAAYQLLIELEKPRALELLDTLFQRDIFEERPLIWKAQLLKDQGKLEEAEKTARQAIAIDPSDGEQGPGRRMRVYAVLADVREARGDKKEAEFLRGAVKAVRTAEEADRFYEAGLISRAVKMYKDSLNFFADAYCIQSRLAVQLSELGRHAEAEEHYRKAYELMPDSFGRVESHCFGCEHVFEGSRAQTLAEKVFTQFAAKNPKKPQIHYLLGILREQQERLPDAVTHFEDATRLDPDYLNAWAKFHSLANRLRLAPARRDAAALNILRLDPFHRHAAPEFEHITDLRALWSIVEKNQKLRAKTPTQIYPLRASAAEQDKAKQPQSQLMHFEEFEYDRPVQRMTPGEVLARTAWLKFVGQLLDSAASVSAR